MSHEPPRRLEVRLIVSVVVKLDDDQLMEALAAAGTPGSVAEVVSSEVASNLESVRYIEAVVVSHL
jgi:RNA 3'-terminal phosphate cyclase